MNPDKEFIFIGPIWKDAQTEKLSHFNNVVFTGRVPHNNAAQYLADFSVAIVPHKQTAFTHSMNTMKVYEYLAAGLPVVSTCAMDGVEKFLMIAKTPGEFSSAIEQAMKENTQERIAERQAFARAHSWKSRVDAMMGIIKVNYNDQGKIPMSKSQSNLKS